MGDSDKENRWAKILADAGLLDEVNDAWELPPGDLAGATISVTGSGAAGVSETADVNRRPTAPSVRTDEVNKVVTIEESGKGKTRRNEDTTMRISTKETPEFRPEALRVKNARATVAGIPISPAASSSSATGRLPVPPARRDTDPATFARHSQAPFLPYDDSDGRPTIEVENQQYYELTMRSDDDTRPTIEDDFAQTASLHDSLSRLQDEHDQAIHDQVVEVCGTRISIASVPPPALEAGAILDLPSHYESEIPELIPEPDDVRPVTMPPPSPRLQMTARYNVGDFSGTLDIAEEILKTDPQNLEALNYRQTCRETLQRMYESRIGDMKRIPKLLISTHELMWRNFDPTTGFILSRFDGHTSFEDLIDISGLPRFDTCRIVAQLLQDAIIG